MGTLEVALRRDWLLLKTHVSNLYLDLFMYGTAGPLHGWGRVCVAEVKLIMWPSCIRAYGTAALTDEYCRGNVNTC